MGVQGSVTRMKIAVCEDDSTQQRHLKALVEAWGNIRGVCVQTAVYGGGDPFLFDWDGRLDFDLLLLDIDLGKGMSGMELARHLREKDRRLQIVFVTGLSEYMSQGYDVQAFHFLVKPVAAERLFEVLDLVSQSLEEKEEYLLITGETDTELIPVHRILYAEAFSHSAALYLTSAKPGGREAVCREIRMGIKELEGKLSPSSFFRCHRSYLVNLACVRKICRNQAILDCEMTVPVSRSREKMFYQAFLEYHRELL